MRISAVREFEIKEKIKQDLYTQPHILLSKKKEVLVENNYKVWIKQYEDTIKMLPDTMIQVSDRVRIKVPAIPFEKFDLPESDRDLFDVYRCVESTWTWDTKEPVPIMMEKTSRYYAESLPIPIQKSLEDEIIALRIEEHTFEKEKRDLRRYLDKTFEACNTTTKLRKAWPTALQKYIPPEPPRAGRKPKPKVEEPATIIAPTDALKQRMTENLLQS